MARITNREIPAHVALLDPFTANSTTGQWVTWLPSVGILPGEWQDVLRRDFHAADTVYIVKSYATPIAWWTRAGGWVVPGVRYSVTTSKVQNLVRRGLRGTVTVGLDGLTASA